MRFLLVDQILELESGRRAVAIKNVAMTEDFLEHHFPGSPIMPGALIAEASIQVANWIIREASDFARSGLAAHLERARFHHIVRPGDQLEIEIDVLEWGDEQVRFKSLVRCRGKKMASGRFTLDLVETEAYDHGGDVRRLFDVLTARLRESET